MKTQDDAKMRGSQAANAQSQAADGHAADARTTDGPSADRPRSDAQRLLAQAQAQALLPETATLAQERPEPSWIITAISFVGAQLVVIPFLAFLGLLNGDFFLELPTSLLTVLALLAGGVVVLRRRPGMFAAQIAFSALLAGVAIFMFGIMRDYYHIVYWVINALGMAYSDGPMRARTVFLPLLLVQFVTLALLIHEGWVQRVLGFGAALAFARIALLPPGEWQTYSSTQDWLLPSLLNLSLLALAWVAWCAHEDRLGGRWWATRLHALADGAGVAMLVDLIWRSLHHAWLLGSLSGAPMGSADSPTAGLAALFSWHWMSFAQAALAVGAGAWLYRRWFVPQGAASRRSVHPSLVVHGGSADLAKASRAGGDPRLAASAHDGAPLQHLRAETAQAQATARERGLWLTLYAALALLAFVAGTVGIIALVGTAALLTGRRRMLALAALALLAELSAFYYALQWPLVNKAALLAGVGAALAMALWALRPRAAKTRNAPAPAAPAANAATPRPPPWQARLALPLLALGLLLAAGATVRDMRHKEQVLAHGQKIFIPLAPRDPRSLMQGDYMALNFSIPAELLAATDDALNAQAGNAAGAAPSGRPPQASPLSSPLMVVARLDERGVATLVRRAHKAEPLAANEVLVPLKYLKDDWVVVTDAYFFPEGQGGNLRNARFGEFRALGGGRVLLAGLADEHLQTLQPAPHPVAE